MSHGGALFEIGPIQVTSVMTTSLAITVIVSASANLGTRKVKVKNPGRGQKTLEYIAGGLRDFYAQILGKERATAFMPVLGTMFIFILLSNYSGLLPGAGKIPGFQPPTGHLGTTVGLAMITFFTVHISGFRYNGAHYLGRFVKPVFFMLPLLLLEEVIHPLSLSLRLYGNIYGEETVLEKISELIPLLAPAIIMGLSLLFGFIQALVFTMLSVIYIEEATVLEE